MCSAAGSGVARELTELFVLGLTSGDGEEGSAPEDSVRICELALVRKPVGKISSKLVNSEK